MLMKEGYNGQRIYGCDEWSTPTINLQLAIDKIDEALSRPTPPEAQAGAVDPLSDLRNAVEFLDQMRAAAESGEDVMGTGIAKDARNWLERAARAAIEPRAATAVGFLRQLDLDNFPRANILMARSADGDWQVPVYLALAAPKAVAQGWISVEERLPACDGETIFIGENEAGYIACFNELTPDGYCMHATAEGSICVMSGLRQWSLVNRPSSPSEEKKA
ncbi:hypothetical protein APR51_08070 [Variovorax paradoxus]|nr:hypothetical protein APR51_08070 [Variovorax paradoxus]